MGWKIKLERTDPHLPLLRKIEDALNGGGWEAAKEVCRNTKGKSAAMAYAMIELFNKYER